MAEAGDAPGFDSFFKLCAGRLYGQAYVLTGSREAAQDLTQEALIRTWKRWHQVSGFEDPEAWTRRVLHNLCIDSWRKESARRRDPLKVVVPTVEIPEHHLQLAEAMRSLPGSHARALLLHDGLGMTISETAQDIGVPEGTVTSWLSRSRRVVAKNLQKPDSESPRR